MTKKNVLGDLKKHNNSIYPQITLFFKLQNRHALTTVMISI